MISLYVNSFAQLYMYVCLYVQISDAVDNGHNKKAVQIADKILKKQGDLHCAKVGGDKFNHVFSSRGWGWGRRGV